MTTPSGSNLIVPPNTPYPQGPKVGFYVPTGSGLVTFHVTVDLPIGLNLLCGVKYWLVNASGSLLINGDDLPNGPSTIVWSLGQDDPHYLYFGDTDALCPGNVIVTSYVLDGATTDPANACDPNPCGTGCTCDCEGPQCNAYSCNCPPKCPTCAPGCVCNAGTGYKCSCPDPKCPSCSSSEYCNAATGYKCVACSPACATGGICGPSVNGCTCPEGECCPPCPTGHTCSGDACHAVVVPPPAAPSSRALEYAAGGLVVLLGAFWLASRNRPAAQPVGASRAA